MKLLLDQNVSAAAAELLRASGSDVFHTREVELATADDADILMWCQRRERILITHDADFHALLAISGATAPSVVRIRVDGLRDEALAELIRKVTETTADDLRRGSAVTVNTRSIRVHRLPLGGLK